MIQTFRFFLTQGLGPGDAGPAPAGGEADR